jgi:hypothetical protein
MKALVVYESMFGDNQQVARAIAAGLIEGGVSAETVEVGVAPRRVDPDVDLLIVGSPNHATAMPRENTRKSAQEQADGPLVSQGIGVREWLPAAQLPAAIRTAAYDTRGSHPKAIVMMDHASSSIEKGLKKLGGSRLVPSEHFLVADMKGPLEPGELDRAHAWGVALAHALQA